MITTAVVDPTKTGRHVTDQKPPSVAKSSGRMKPLSRARVRTDGTALSSETPNRKFWFLGPAGSGKTRIADSTAQPEAFSTKRPGDNCKLDFR
jgi:hypothetical protein